MAGIFADNGRYFCRCVGRAVGAFLGGFLIDRFNYPSAMTFASLFTILSFVWWVPSLKTFLPDYQEVKLELDLRADQMAQLNSNPIK